MSVAILVILAFWVPQEHFFCVVKLLLFWLKSSAVYICKFKNQNIKRYYIYFFNWQCN